MLRNKARLLVFALLCAGTAWSGSDDVDSYVKQQMMAQKIPGVAFAVVDHGNTVVERAYGSENLETDTPLSLNGVFEIASVTKPFTATAIMLLAQEGKLGLDDRISKYIDHTPAAWQDITVRELLSHTSGIPGLGWVECDGSPLLHITTQRYFDEIAKLPLHFAPGSAAEYSDSGYFLLGMIIERVSGMRYAEFMQKRLFEPFGMTSTSILDRRLIVKNHVSEYTLVHGELEHDRRVWQHDLPSYFGMLSTTDDLGKWVTALSSGRVVKPEVLNQMWTVAKLNNGQPVQLDGMPYGLGWFIVDVNGHHIVGHPGFLGSVLFHYVEDHVTVIVLTNLDVASGSHQIALAQGIIARVRPELPRFLP